MNIFMHFRFFFFFVLVSHAGMILNVFHNSRAFYRIIIKAYCILDIVLFFFFPKKEQGEGNIDVRLCLQPE